MVVDTNKNTVLSISKEIKIISPGKVATIEYDPNRSANIALINYVDGEKRYILAPKGLEVGMEIISGEEADIKVGNALPMGNMPEGTVIHNIENVNLEKVDKSQDLLVCLLKF